MRWVLVIIFFSFAGQSFAQGIDEIVLENPEQEALARAIMQDIRCLTCQNQSIDESDADLARQLRVIVREQVENGASQEEIKSYLVARYGDWILMQPPLRMRTILLWTTPFILLIFGGWLLLSRRQKGVDTPKPLSKEEQEKLYKILGDDL